ncbi:MAG: hypothetical protein Q9167_001220 [Letrouitia subvulpina]
MIRCDLRTVSLVDDAHPQYVALSYTWGDPSVTTGILVNDCVFKATTNLVAALRSLRSNWYQVIANRPVLRGHKEFVGPLWIDAICIDQGNNEERSQQVQIMRRIYATANFVVSWLGEKLPQHVAGMEALVQIHHALETKANYEDYSWLEENTSLWQWDVKTREPNTAWKSIAQILDFPYWKRVWIIQELIVCKWALAMLGDLVLPFSAFSHFCDFCKAVNRSLKVSQISPLLHIYAQVQTLQIDLSSLSHLLAIRYKFEIKELMSLQWLLSRFYKRLATDPRDKIFGLLGIANTSMKADYNKSAEDLYQELALMWTDKVSAPSLDFFLYSGFSQIRPDASWPSWVPDWHALQASISFIPWGIFMNDRAPGPFTKMVLQRPITVEQRRLRVSGLLADQIVATNRVNYGETYGDMKRDLLRLMVETIQNYGPKFLMPLMRCLMWCEGAEDDNSVLEQFIDMFQHLRTFAQNNGVDILPELEDAMLKGAAGKTNLVDFHLIAHLPFWRRSVCHTSKGHLAAAAPNAQVADFIAIVPGCSCPILLRRVELWYVHLGPCYVDSLTEVGVCKLLKDDTAKMENFEIR